MNIFSQNGITHYYAIHVKLLSGYLSYHFLSGQIYIYVSDFAVKMC